MQVEENVQSRYSQGAQERQEALCCPVDYDVELLKILPQEIIDKDYGCGDPSRFVKEGDVVLDLGSGGGKICYMAAQLVGSQGKVLGVDMTDDMLALARKYQGEMADKLGNNRVAFHKGYIQDLAFDVHSAEQWLRDHPVKTIQDMQAFEMWKVEQRRSSPMIADNSVTLVISNCVLNLVARDQRRQMIEEIYRVLKPGGRVAIADIVCDEEVPEALQDNPELWSGCISGAFHEKEFLEVFQAAGFVGVGYAKWDAQPWRVVEGIEFRSVTLAAVKPSKEDLYDGGHGVIYRGPFSYVEDDLGNHYPRGERIAVSKRTFDLLMSDYYRDYFIGIEPSDSSRRGSFCKPAGTIRVVEETKGGRCLGVAAYENGGCC